MMGLYIYSVIETGEEKAFDAVPMAHHPTGNERPATGDRQHGVYTICHNGLAAVVSDVEMREYPLTRENMLAHQRVNEAVMRDYVVLPVKFCTIAESRGLIVEKLLEGKRDELLSKLRYLADKREFSLKVLWKEMPLVFVAIVEENPAIKKLKLKLEKVDPNRQPASTASVRGRLRTALPDGGGFACPYNRTRDGFIEIGEMVKQALDEKKEAVGSVVYDRLAALAIEAKKNPLYGDKMPLNAVFLVARDREADLDKEINHLAEENAGSMDWKYVGPTPAANFVEIVVTW